MINKDLINKLGLEKYKSDLDIIENYRYLRLIYHPLFDRVVTQSEYDRTKELMEWTCAICGKKILIHRRKYDVENFVCKTCQNEHNNKSVWIDRRILDSRTKLYKFLEDKLYKELEDRLNKGKGEVE